MSERKSGAISGHSVRLYGSFLFTQETRNIWQNKYAVITCDRVINICLLILKCLLSSIYQIWVGLECKPNKGTQLDHHDNKTQCQPCKRLAWPIIPQSWSGLAWKSVSPMDVITLGQSTTIFLCIRPFSMRTKQPTKQQGDPSASLLLTSENAVYCNCDHIGFYGQYGKKLPAMMITDAYGLHQQPLSMSLYYILDPPDAGFCLCLCVLYPWPLLRCWSTSRAASPPSPTSQPTPCPLSTSTRFLSSSTWK